MSNVTLNESFTLDAPAELVWDRLIDPMRTVECLPGAEITGQDDERTYSGAVKVKVGSVTMSYRGKVVFEEIDEAARYVKVVGKGRERSGSGSATMTLESRIVALPDGSSEVSVDSEVRLTGRIVRFGRGMIDTISAEIFKEFRSRLAASLRQELEEERSAEGESEDERIPTLEIPAPVVGDRDEGLALIPLIWRALRSWLSSLFGRGGEDRPS